MEYRVEQKYIVTDAQIEYIKARMNGFVKIDPNMDGDSYLIRSVYFDDMRDTCLSEVEAGVDNREKFRIRIYNNDVSLVKLELKGKKNGYTSKKTTELTKEETDALLHREAIYGSGNYLKTKISAKMQCVRLQPVCIVEYERTAYVDEIGNVRITFDRNIGGTENIEEFYNPQICAIPALPVGQHIMEVKYDELLPDYIKEIIDIGRLARTSFSKYYFVRMAGMV